MNKDLLRLTAKDIYEKNFKFAVKGYDIREVDSFLDEIIKDYTNYDNMLKKLAQELENANNELVELKKENRNLKTSLEVYKTNADSDGNVESVNSLDIMRRLSQLEKTVYGKGE